MNDEVGKRLCEERNRLGMTQVELVSYLNINKKTQSFYESGRTYPSGQYLAAIANIGADVAYILTGIRSRPSTDECIQDMLDSIIYLENWLVRQGGSMEPDIKAHAVKLVYDAWGRREEKGEIFNPDKNLEKILVKLMT